MDRDDTLVDPGKPWNPISNPLRPEVAERVLNDRRTAPRCPSCGGSHWLHLDQNGRAV